MTDEEAYRLLELDEGASAEEIRKAYRKLAKVWHPDRLVHDAGAKPRATERLQAINAAYEHLRRRPAERSTPPRPESDPGRSASRHRRAASRRGEREIWATLIDWCWQPVPWIAWCRQPLRLIAWCRQPVSWCLRHPTVATATSCGLVLIAAAAVAGMVVLPLQRSGTTAGTHTVVAVARVPEALTADGADEQRQPEELVEREPQPAERQSAERQPVTRQTAERRPRAAAERARPAPMARLHRKKAEEPGRFDVRAYSTDLRVWGN